MEIVVLHIRLTKAEAYESNAYIFFWKWHIYYFVLAKCRKGVEKGEKTRYLKITMMPKNLKYFSAFPKLLPLECWLYLGNKSEYCFHLCSLCLVRVAVSLLHCHVNMAGRAMVCLGLLCCSLFLVVRNVFPPFPDFCF